jgi:integrase
MPIKLTARNVLTLPAKDARRTNYVDELVPGLVLRVSPTGERTFSALYYDGNGKRVRYTIGTIPPLSLADARQKAKEVLLRVELGVDPALEKRRAKRRVQGEGTVAGLAGDFLASRESAKWRPKTRQEFERLVRTEIVPAIGHLDPAAVTRGIVRQMVERIADGVRSRNSWLRKPAPYVANRVLQVTKLLWSWALDRERVQASPVVGLKKPTEEKPRDIEYTDDQIRAIFDAATGADDCDLADLIGLLFYTGGRLNEVQGMEWAEINVERAEWRLPPERSKVGRKKARTRLITLVAPVVDILRRRRSATRVIGIHRARYVFPAVRGLGHMTRRTKVLTRLKRVSGVENFMPHGIRHTIRARLARLGIAPHVSERVLGHTLRGMEGQYTGTGVEFLPEMRDALDRWAEELAGVLARTTQESRDPAKAF